MAESKEKIFRSGATERLSSVEQLDQLVSITRPFDWVAALAMGLGLIVLVAWGVLGKIPTRVEGEGILLSSGGRVVDAVAGVAGRLASIDVAVGDEVTADQVIAHLGQTDIEQRLAHAREVLREREREHEELNATIAREIETKLANYEAQEAGLNEAIVAADQRATYLTADIAKLEPAVANGFVTRKTVEDRRVDLNAAKLRIVDAQNDILKLKAQRLDLQSQRDRDRMQSQFRVNDAKRLVEQLSAELDRGSRLLAPAGGRVVEIKVSTGSVLAVGAPVIEIETSGQTLEATIYMPPDRGKDIRPGMQVHVEPTMIAREEYGAIIGTVVAISEFPVTPQGMAADLHNDTLVKRFSENGAPYAALVRLEANAATVSGYRWSSGKGPPVRLSAGTLTRAEVTTREQAPVQLVIPFVKRLSGVAG